MENLIIIAILLIIAGLAVWYIIKSKKSGNHCIGCPHAKNCTSKNCSCNKD